MPRGSMSVALRRGNRCKVSRMEWETVYRSAIVNVARSWNGAPFSENHLWAHLFEYEVPFNPEDMEPVLEAALADRFIVRTGSLVESQIPDDVRAWVSQFELGPEGGEPFPGPPS